MENKSKAQTFIGFAIRARKFKLGFNACATLKSAKLMIVCRSASPNTQKESFKLSKRLNCPLITTVEKDLTEYVMKENAKVMAITDTALADAILSNVEKEFIVVNQENLNG